MISKNKGVVLITGVCGLLIIVITFHVESEQLVKSEINTFLTLIRLAVLDVMLSLLAVFPLIEHCTSIRNKQKVFGFLQQ
jgi:fluoride ion exporter CrcB/FEX